MVKPTSHCSVFSDPPRNPAAEAPAGQPQPLTWKSVFFAHLDAAIHLLRRDIKNIFLLEHREEAHAFAEEIEAFCKAQHQLKAKAGDNAWKDTRVRCLLIDLIGNVTDL